MRCFMLENKKIKTALVSVFHKDGLDEILKLLHAEGVNFISTGGTQSFIESLGIPVIRLFWEDGLRLFTPKCSVVY